MKKWLMIGIVAAIVLSLLGWFLTADDGGDTVEAWHSLAERGDAEAQYNLAVAYAIGEGVEQDCEEAVKWYRLFAEQADAPAEFLQRYERQFEIGFIESLLLTRCSINTW